MKPAYIAFCLLAVLMFSLTASAITIDGPSNLVFDGQTKEVSYYITNNDSGTHALEVMLFVPFNYEIIESPTVIEPLDTEIVRIKLMPTEALEGDSYSSKIAAKIGEDTGEKNLTLWFKEIEEEPDNGEDQPGGTPTGFVPFMPDMNVLYDAYDGLVEATGANPLSIVLILVVIALAIWLVARLYKNRKLPKEFSETGHKEEIDSYRKLKDEDLDEIMKENGKNI